MEAQGAALACYPFRPILDLDFGHAAPQALDRIESRTRAVLQTRRARADRIQRTLNVLRAAHVKRLQGDRHWLPVLWIVEACVAGGAVLTLARGGSPGDMVLTIAFLFLCGATLTLPGPALRRVMVAARLSASRRQLVLQLYLALAAAAVAGALATARGWAAVVAILVTGNALLTLELESREEVGCEGD
jgi:hypothetical protein